MKDFSRHHEKNKEKADIIEAEGDTKIDVEEDSKNTS